MDTIVIMVIKDSAIFVRIKSLKFIKAKYMLLGDRLAYNTGVLQISQIIGTFTFQF